MGCIGLAGFDQFRQVGRVVQGYDLMGQAGGVRVDEPLKFAGQGKPFGCDRCHDAGQAGGETFDDLALDARAETQRGDTEAMGCENGTQILHMSQNTDAVIGEGLEALRHVRSDQGAADGWISRPDGWHDLVHQPAGRIGVRRMGVIADEHHAASTDSMTGLCRNGPRNDMYTGLWQILTKPGGFCLGMRQDGIGLKCSPVLCNTHLVGLRHQFRPPLNRCLTGKTQEVQIRHAVEDAGPALVAAYQCHIPRRDVFTMQIHHVEAVCLTPQHVFH